MNNPYRILSVEDPADAVKLARKAKRVKNPQSTEVVLGIQRMKRAATKWEHETGRRCEGLAAPQIGWNARVIIVRVTNQQEPKNPRDFTPAEYEAVCGPSKTETEWKKSQVEFMRLLQDYKAWAYQMNGFFDPWQVMINPTIKQVEGERKATEGCLSVTHGGYEVTRPTHVAFKFTTPNKKYSGVHLAKFVGKDTSAQILMHEVEHLQGKCINTTGTVIIGGGDEKL